MKTIDKLVRRKCRKQIDPRGLLYNTLAEDGDASVSSAVDSTIIA